MTRRDGAVRTSSYVRGSIEFVEACRRLLFDSRAVSVLIDALHDWRCTRAVPSRSRNPWAASACGGLAHGCYRTASQAVGVPQLATQKLKLLPQFAIAVTMTSMESLHQPVEAVYQTRVRKDCRKYGLVLEAVGIDFEVHESAGELTLFVAVQDAARARAELTAYAQENSGSSSGATPLAMRADGWRGVVGYVMVLLIVAILERQNAFDFDWFAAGRTHAGLIRQGEWWRAVTALSLHADLAHLIANIVIGGLFGLFAGQLLGSGLAWSSILIAGTAGNLLNAWIRPPDHTSVGASTAVFAALGMMAALAWQWRRHSQKAKLARWAPLIGGVVLLSFLGVGGARTDVAAHVTGFLSGALLGTLYGKLGRRVMLTARTQFLLGMGALMILAFAWAAALVPHTPRGFLQDVAPPDSVPPSHSVSLPVLGLPNRAARFSGRSALDCPRGGVSLGWDYLRPDWSGPSRRHCGGGRPLSALRRR